tara:strand:+ start:7445 stop:13681 length:6237 start_codon:yes stop_codon:yes gene_type:complete
MAKLSRNFVAGKMNKSVDERLVPNGQYIDAVNVRLGSSESTEVGAVENSKGNTKLTSLSYGGVLLSNQAKCIGSVDDGANDTIYWFITDPAFGSTSPSGKLDLIVSYNVVTSILSYLVISVSDGSSSGQTVLNFDDKHLITGVNVIDGLLFWTDDYNPPRFLNILRNYEDPSGSPLVDGGGNASLLRESLLVIKKPPARAPEIELTFTSGGQENFLEERFISFAYRYEYQDDEYSAVSQFTDAAFQPQAFNFSPESFLNEGAINRYNTAVITYNSGGPLVTAIDLLFKDSDGTIIKVIEKLKKSELGLADNTNYTFNFRNSKIFTILPESELLRLYDNVPLLAKAQTIMGNRLMYGNYIENYNLVDKNNSPVRFEYVTELISENIGLDEVEDTFLISEYTIDGSVFISDSMLLIELESELKAGGLLNIDATIEHSAFTDNTPTETSGSVDVQFSYVLPQDFNNAYELATSLDFQEKIGIATNIKPVFNIDPAIETSCDGVTFTDSVNCAIPNILDGGSPTSWTKYESGISAPNQPLRIGASPSYPNQISIRLVAMRRVNNTTTPTQSAYEYFKWSLAEVTYQSISNTKSLHSNRDYEIGMVYMDEFNRASTALVSPLNTEHVPCGFAELKNSIRVSIPPQQKPPYWATKYKFAIKPNASTYETVYTNIFFTDPATNDTYFLLEGENSRKVEVGDRLIVKSDTSGALQRCAYGTVLDKEAQQRDFLDPLPTDENGKEINIPAGTYMKIKAQDFSIAPGADPFILPGKQEITVKGNDNYPILAYTGFAEPDDAGNYQNLTIPAGSRIQMTFEFERRGPQRGNNACERRKYNLDVTLVSSNDYDNIIEWFEGDNVQSVLNTGTQEVGGNGGPIDNVYLGITNSPLPCAFNLLSNCTYGITPALGTNYYKWFQDPNTQEIRFIMSGTRACGRTKKRRSTIRATWQIFRAESTIIFETEPTDAQPDVWYEGAQTFDIAKGGCKTVFQVASSESNPIAFVYTLDGIQSQLVLQPGDSAAEWTDCGSAIISPSTPPDVPADVTITNTPYADVHLGNVQDQDATNPAIIDTTFFNCFAFGNGVESYKVRDSIVGKPLLLGNRVTTTSSEDYREADRFADITYSGIYNDESNVNKLNEFNLGLINFKRTEESFGPIEKLFARATDILTLQEDKISYVLAGKNLLSDSVPGGAITSVPEVLGTQIARLEEYGISFNPESFAEYGFDKYFSDQKRGVLIQLKGSSYSNEQLTVISDAGMRSWFRDKFIAAPNTQKLGGYDPYMDEYVFSINDEMLPIDIPCVECGINQLLNYDGTTITYCFNVGDLVGEVTITLNVSGLTSGTLQAQVEYGASTSLTNLVNGVNTITVIKNLVLTDTVSVTFDGTASAVIDYTVSCVDAKELSIVQVCVTNNSDAGQFIHNQYRWVDGPFISPLHQEQIEFLSSPNSPNVSQYSTVTGVQGAGVIPADGAIVSIISNKIPPTDDFVFVTPPMNFKYLRSATLYSNTPASIQTLLNASTQLPVNSSGAPSTYLGDFIMPAGTSGDYLYLIYDYRSPVLAELCYSTVDAFDSCCGCSEPDAFVATQCRADGVVETEVVQGVYTTGELVIINGCTFEIGAVTLDAPTATVTSILPSGTTCDDICQEYLLENTNNQPTDVSYTDCNGATELVTIPANDEVTICAIDIDLQAQGVDFFLENCECDPVAPLLVAERCVIDWSTGGYNQVIIVNNGLFNIGDLITINEDADCTYVIVDEEYKGSANATSTGLSTAADCTEVCNFYTVTNNASTFDFIYTNCNGTVINETIAIGSFKNICAKDAAPQPDFDLVWTSCECPASEPSFVNLERCQASAATTIPTTYIANNASYNVNDIVQIDNEPDCKFKVVSFTEFGPANTNIINTYPGEDCSDVCNEYTLTNTAGGSLSLNYIDCNGLLVKIDVTSPVVENICASSITPALGIVVEFVSCECNLVASNYSIQECVTGEVRTVTSSIAVSVGDKVELQSGDGCKWTITGTSANTATDDIIALSSNQGCVCNSYTWENNTGSNLTLEYVDCLGTPVSQTIIPTEVWNACISQLITNDGATVISVTCTCF